MMFELSNAPFPVKNNEKFAGIHWLGCRFEKSDFWTFWYFCLRNSLCAWLTKYHENPYKYTFMFEICWKTYQWCVSFCFELLESHHSMWAYTKSTTKVKKAFEMSHFKKRIWKKPLKVFIEYSTLIEISGYHQKNFFQKFGV